jgi:RNA polymerase-binding transcription factor DksA
MKNNFAHFETKLNEERKVLTQELSNISVNTKTKGKDDWEATPSTEIDSADANNVADRISAYENNDALVSNLEARLREIDLALNKIGKEIYGTCEVCNNPIEEDRLEANPAARTCKKHLNDHLPTPQL